MAKAFLAHSSIDKDYVDIVARKLSRANIIYDKRNFEPGVDFREAIRQGLDQSVVFVLFASRNSLASTWVKFEIDEAEIRRIAGRLKSVLVVLIDPTVEIRSLPEWMRRAKVAIQPRPTQAARIILSRLVSQEGEQQPLFVGREDLLQDIAKELVPGHGALAPQVLVASGLEGVGRRTVMQRALSDNLSLQFGPMLYLEETDSLDRLYLLLREETADLGKRDKMAEAIAVFNGSDARKRAELIAEELVKIAADNVATVIVDEGALMDEGGRFRPETELIFTILGASEAEPYVVLIQRRRPPLSPSSFGEAKLATLVVPPLSLDATRRLLLQSMKAAAVPVKSEEDVEEVARYVAGYPPAAGYAVSYSKRYGFEALVADKSSLVDMKVRAFGRLIKKLEPTESEQLILRVLGMEPAVSLDVLATMTQLTVDELLPVVRKLIDENVVIQYSGQFSLAAPLRDAVYREFGYITSDEYGGFAQKLKDRYWQNADEVPILDAIEATIFTVA